MLQRPRLGDTEEDLLEYQKLFLASKRKPAAALHRVRAPQETCASKVDEEPRKGVVFDSSAVLPCNGSAETTPAVLRTVQEHTCQSQFCPSPELTAYKSGFPEVPVLDINPHQAALKSADNNKSKQSLFARKYLASKGRDFGQQPACSDTQLAESTAVPRPSLPDPGSSLFSQNGAHGVVSPETSCPSKLHTASQFADYPLLTQQNYAETAFAPVLDRACSSEGAFVGSGLVTGSGLGLSLVRAEEEVRSIAAENAARLKTFTQEEILEERKNLLTSLDPKLLEFIKTRKTNVQLAKASEVSSQDGTASRVTAVVGSNPAVGKVSPTDAELPREASETPFAPAGHVIEVAGGQGPVTEQRGSEVPASIDPYKEFNISEGLLHMDVVEHEKLRWMSRVPQVKCKDEESAIPRFDFAGNLVTREGDVPAADQSLFHHGDEAERPGYTLEELFGMARANHTQQRVVALQTIAQIIDQYHKQKFDGLLSSDLLQQVLAAGLPFILRWSLDESCEQIVSAAMAGLAAILFIKSDQVAVDKFFYTKTGAFMPSLCKYFKKDRSQMTQEELEEDRDLKDAELISRDLIKGLLQMQLLPRLRYITAKMELSPVALANCMNVLTRIAQHDKASAYEIEKCPGLLEAALKRVLNAPQNHTSLATVAGLRLVRALCIASKTMAFKLLEEIGLKELLGVYVSQGLDPGTLSPNLASIYKHGLQVLSTLLLHGAGIDLLIDLHSVVIMQLRNLLLALKEAADETLASLVMLSTSAAVAVRDLNDLDREGPKKLLQVDQAVLRRLAALVEGLKPLVVQVLESIKGDVLEGHKITHPLSVAACMRFMSAFFTQSHELGSGSKVGLLEQTESFMKDFIEAIVMSKKFDDLWRDMKTYSDFKDRKPESISQDYPESLPTYGTKLIPGACPMSIAPGSPAILVGSLLEFLLTMVQLNKGLAKALPQVMQEEILAYVMFLCQSTSFQKRAVSLLTSLIEQFALFDLLELFCLVGDVLGYAKYSRVAVDMYETLLYHVLPIMPSTHRKLARTLMRNVVFNPNILCKPRYVFMLFGAVVPEEEYSKATKEILDHLPSIGSMYERYLFDSIAERKRADSFLGPEQTSTALPCDWMYLPIVSLYNDAMKLESRGALISAAREKTVTTLTYNLEFVLLLEVMAPGLIETVGETIRLTRIMCVFLIEGNVFLEPPVQHLLLLLVTLYAQPKYQGSFDFEAKLPGITSFYDLFTSLLQQYASSSYGDSVFANILLLPLQNRYDVKYRKALWGEYRHVLRVFPLSITQVTHDVNSYLASCDDVDDPELIDMFYRALERREATPEWCPFLYLVAVQHVNNYVFKTDKSLPQDDNIAISKGRLGLLKSVAALSNLSLKEDIIYYNYCNPDAERGFVKYERLPAVRQLLLENRDCV